jgi:transposase
MVAPHTLSGLIEKRAEVVRRARDLEDQLAQARSDVLHLDAVIRLFDPASEPEAILPKDHGRKLNWFADGELPRRVFDVLRTATELLSVREIATEVMQRRGFNPEDAATLATVEKRVSDILRRRADVVEKVKLGPRAVGWRVAADP